MPERVVDEVAERLLEASAVGVELEAGRRLHLDRAIPPVEAGGDGLEQLGNLHGRASQRQPFLSLAREHEQVLGQPHEPLDLLAGRAQRALQLLLRPGPPQRELQLGPERRERRAQLVAGVRDETTLALETRVEPAEHRVERLAETSDLVLRRRQREPSARRGRGDLRGTAPHRVDRTQGGPRQQIAGHGGEQQRNRPDDEQLPQQARERLIAVLERGPDDDREPAPVHVDPPGEPADARRLEPGALGKHRPVRAEDSEEGLVVAVELRRGVLADQRRNGIGPRVERLVELLLERIPEPDVEERSDGCEHERHREREDEREPKADRQPAHWRSSLRSR